MNIIIQKFECLRPYFILLLCSLLSTSTIISNEYKLKKIDSYQGLSQNTVNVIFEDNFGLIWVGTNNGLNRFDGNRIYKFEKSNVKEVKSSKITDIKQSGSKILISIYGVGIVEYDYKSDSFQKLNISFNTNQKLINSIFWDNINSTIWGATSGGGVFAYNTKTHRIRSYFDSGNNTLGTSEINTIEVIGNNVYVGGENGNIISINKSDYTINDLIYKSTSSILGLSSIGEKLLVSSSEQNLKSIDVRTEDIKTFNFYYNNNTDFKTVRKVTINADSILTIPTVNGVLRAKYHNNSIDIINLYNNENSKFGYNIFNYSLIDSKGSLWLGSNEEGLFYQNKVLSKFKVYKFNEIDNIPFKSVRAINSKDNNLWVGGYGGLVILDLNFNVRKVISNQTDYKKNSKHNFIPTDNIHSILFDKNNSNIVWLGTEGIGLFRYNINNNTYTNFLTFNQNSKLHSLNNVFDIDYLDNTLILSTSEGLVSFDTENINFTNIELLNKVIQKESLKIKSTYIVNNTAYISILGSTPIIFNFETGEVIKVVNLLPEKMKEIIYNTNQIMPYKDNSLIIATNTEGVIIHNFETDKSVLYNYENGLLNNTINQVLLDKNDDLWVSTNIGLAKIDKAGVISNFNNRKYELNNEYNTGASYIYNDSIFIFGATNGITTFNPSEFVKFNTNSDYLISKGIFNSIVNDYIYNMINNDTIVIDDDIYAMSFDFIETNTLFGDEPKFKFRINNTDWIDFDGQILLENIELKNFNVIEFSKHNEDSKNTQFFLIYNPKHNHTYLYYIVILFIIIVLIVLYRKRKIKYNLETTETVENLNIIPQKLSVAFVKFNRDFNIIDENNSFIENFNFKNSDSLYKIFSPEELDSLYEYLLENPDERIIKQKISFKSDRQVSLFIIKCISDNEYRAFVELETNTIDDRNYNSEIDRIFSVFIDTILEPLIITNWNGDIMFANKEAMKFLEITNADIPEVNLLKYLNLTGDHSFYKAILSTKEGLSFRSERFDLEFKNKQFVIEGSGNSLNYLGRNLFIIIFKNITPQIKVMNQLTESKINAERLSELKSLYISNLSHELKTPINAISGFTDLLYNKKTNASNLTYLDTIKSNTELLIQLIDDLLLYSKAETGKLIMRPVPTNINSLILELKNLFQLDFEKQNIKFDFEFHKSGIEQLLNIDQLKLKQVLINIVGNSIKHTENGNINLLIKLEKQSDGKVTMDMKIKDDGVGIPKDKLNEIFTAFSQVDDDKDKGTGLGLAITKKIIDSMNGVIKVNSTLNEGTEFQVTINNINLVIPKKHPKTDSKFNEKILDSIFHKDNNLHIYKSETLINTKSKLNGKLKSMQQDIQTNFLLNDINLFAKELESLGVETNIGFILNYAEELNNATKSIEVEKINTILENFHKLELTVDKLIEKNND